MVILSEPSPNQGIIGKTFKKDAKRIVEALNRLDTDGLNQLDEALTSAGYQIPTELWNFFYLLLICSEFSLDVGGDSFKLTKDMVSVKKCQKTVHTEEVVPNVIEPSFGIGRIMYSVFEHNFQMRDGDEQRTVI